MRSPLPATARRTFVHLLRWRAVHQPDHPAYGLITRDGAGPWLSYADLDRRARSVAAALAAVASPGDRVLILHPPGPDYVAAFFGCLYAGTVAVPAYPPTFNRRLARLLSIIDDAAPVAALTNDRIATSVARRLPEYPALARLQWLSVESLEDRAEDWKEPELDPAGLAFLQYTSGSTATPKGVMVSHANLLHNCDLMAQRLGCGPDSRMVSWVPPYHDMGLIGGLLLPMYEGFDAVLMAPATFATDPRLWLEAVTEHRGTVSFSSNFALDLCVDRIGPEQRSGLDLSSWQTLVVGAEPVRPATLDRFTAAFAPYGLRADCIRPAYGLAEATLAVSMSQGAPVVTTVDDDALQRRRLRPLPTGDPAGRPLTGCGENLDPAAGRVAIVDPDTGLPCPPEQLGEIWVTGPSIAGGYWRRPEQTGQTFRAYLPDGDGPYLRTGDLGFLRDGQVYPAGRIKDLIIVRGRNLYPQDVEACAEAAHPALRRDASAALAVDRDDEEQLLIVAEATREHLQGPEDVDRVAEAVSRAVAEEFEVAVAELVLIRAGTIPKTSSGKIQRSACRTALADEQLHVLGRWRRDPAPTPAPATGPAGDGDREALVRHLCHLVERTLPGRRTARPEDSLLSLGLDSIATLQLLGQVEAELRVSLDPELLLDNPTVADLADAVRAAGGGPGPVADDRPTTTADPAARHEPFPLTDIQQAYVLGRTDSFELGNVSTHAYLEFSGTGIDLPRLERAWQRLIERHDMLRAVMLPGTHQQRVLPEVPPYQIAVTDLRGLPPEQVTREIEAVRQRLSHEVRPADQWPLFELSATRMDGDELRLHLSVDALICDFASARVLLRELGALYQDPEVALPERQLTFRDYVLAERAVFDGSAAEESRRYWRQRVEQLPPAPDLPLATQPAAVTRPRFVRRSVRLPQSRWAALQAQATRAGLTPTGALLAAYAEVLSRWAATAHFTLNVPRQGRLPLHPDVPDLVGEFASFVLVEVDYREPGAFQDRARRLQRQLWTDLRHPYVSGVQVLRDLMQRQGGFDRALMPVVMTSTLATPGEADPVPGVPLRQVYGITQTPQVWLDCQVEQQGDELVVGWDAVEQLFPDGMLDEAFTAFTTLLEALTDPDAWQRPDPLAGTVAAPAPVRGDGPRRWVPDLLVPDLFAAQVAQRPDQPAVVAADRVLSYAELAERAAGLAHWLREAGAAPDRLVGIVMDKGWEQVVAAYAVLWSGAAYLPIDAAAPPERIRHLLRRGDVQLVLTHTPVDQRTDWPDGVTTLRVDLPPVGLPTTPPPPVQTPDQLAYTLFTSGSTGEPKGAMITHRGVVNALRETIDTYQLGPDDRCLGVTALHHDMSLFDVFGVLGAGGTLVLPEAGATRDAATWADLVARHRVTVWNSVPAMLEMLVDQVGEAAGDRLGSLRLAFTGGDWIPLALAHTLARRLPGLRLVSVGGPTETTLWNIWYPVERIDPGWRSIPYGRPIANTTYRILDAQGRDRPVWAAGEMCVAGVGVARGYWRDPERTAASFVTDPVTGQRLYRTGDLGRFRPDGTIEFLGRADTQVKVRGQRIELGEVEAALAAHPRVERAVVTPVPHPDRPGYRALAGYVVPARADTTDTADFGDPGRSGVEITDPVARAEFKLADPGRRRLPAEAPRVRLRDGEPDGPERERILRRRSDRQFLPGPVPLADLADCLAQLCRIEVDGLPKYRYPSGGGLYPVQTYLHVPDGAVSGLEAGAYYLDPAEGSLVRLGPSDPIPTGAHAPHNRALAEACGFTLFFVADLAAIEPMYGDLAWSLCLIEAGYLGQTLLTWAADHDLGLCPVGDLDFERIAGQFQLGDRHRFVHAMLGGRVDRAATPAPAPVHPGQLDLAELRQWLRGTLPEHMVPAYLTVLPSLPLTANGKVDRSALPAPGASVTGRDYQAPRTPTERRLTELWAELLQVPRVGTHDNFFELGGHSLTAARLVARVRDELGVELPLRRVFQERTAADLAAAIDAERDRGTTPAAPQPPALVPDPQRRHEPFPLTDVQHAYWLGRFGMYELGDVATTVYLQFETDDFDPARAEAVLAAMVERHDMLRAVVDSEGRQRVLPEVPRPTVTVEDLTGLEPAAAEAVAAGVWPQIATADRPGGQWPLFGVRAQRMPGGATRVHLFMDMLIADATSIVVFLREWATLYPDPDRPLPALRATFRDYQLALAGQVDSGAYRQARDYWLERVPTLPPAPQLPLAAAPGSVRGRFVHREHVLDAAAWQRLTRRAREHGVTPSAVLCAAYAEVVGAWSASGHFTVNLTVGDRAPVHPDVDDIIGDFTSLTLLEVDLRPPGGFADRVRRLQERLWQDLEHRQFNAVQVMRELARQRSAAQVTMPVVFTSVLDRDFGSSDGHLPGLGRLVGGGSQTSQVYLDHQVFELGGRLHLSWDAVDSLFPAGMVDDMFAAYRQLVERLAGPDDTAWAAPVTPTLPTHRQLVAAANDTAGPVPGGLLHHPLAARAAARPDDVAVIDAAGQWTFGQLWTHACGLAHQLRTAGVGRGDRVAVCLPKGADQVVAVLGVLLAGAAYLPVDPGLPVARRRLLAERGRVRAVVARPEAAVGVQLPQVRWFDPAAVVPAEQPPEPVASPSDLAYVIFTSGSTGEPKGVMVSHRAALNTCLDVNQRYGVGATDRVLGLSALNFDLSVWDVFGVLGAGGTLVLPPPDASRDPGCWSQLVTRHQVTVWNTVPALMQMLVEYHTGDPAARLPLRLVLLSGDWIPVGLPDRIRALAPPARVVSLGGATEAAIWSIAYPVDTVDPDWDSIPYGRPLTNQEFHVLNDRWQECPVWVPGELYIGGVGLAEGYWDDPEKTAASFVTHPDTGQRLYRTGDLGRWRPDGTIEFLGRRDHQVKVGGHRIELGEIETVLQQHPDVDTAIVTARGDRHQRRLVAYLYPGPAGAEARTLVESVRAYAAELLPHYMVPGTWQVLSALPLTANGKVDRSALPDPAPVDPGVAGAGEPVAAPATELETTILTEVQRVVGDHPVSVTANLFELGVDSVAIVRIHRNLQTSLGREFPLTALFEHATIRGLAASLAGPGEDDDEISAAYRRARRARRRPSPPRPAAQQEAQP